MVGLNVDLPHRIPFGIEPLEQDGPFFDTA
jgi:hypothetical protein